jgi:hypothetical protein
MASKNSSSELVSCNFSMLSTLQSDMDMLDPEKHVQKILEAKIAI